MDVRQISVFVENKPGKLLEITKVLADENIDMRALSLGETSDYGILRIIVSDTDKAAESLRAAGAVINVTPVVAIEVPDEPGSLQHVLTILADAGISINYTYAFLMNRDNSACLVLRVDDPEATKALLKQNGVEVLEAEIFEN